MVDNVNEKKGLTLLQTLHSKKEDLEDNNHCADIHMDKNGKFLYGSNRGENTIATFKIGKDGLLTLAGYTSCGGDWPRSFILDPTGKYMLVGNQKSDSISVLKINRRTGLPSKLVSGVKMKIPACLKFY